MTEQLEGQRLIVTWTLPKMHRIGGHWCYWAKPGEDPFRVSVVVAPLAKEPDQQG